MEPIIDEPLGDEGHKPDLRRVLRILTILDYVSFAFLAAGVLFKVQHWPYAFLFMCIALVSLLILAVIKVAYAREKLAEAIRNLAITFIVTGSIFRINHYPFSTALIIGGLVFLLAYYFLGTNLKRP
jgi:hypothetical protein